VLLQRNYHIFYQLIAGADSAMKKRLHLKPPAEYSYLNQSGTFLALWCCLVCLCTVLSEAVPF
jgi:hypothetical protein